MSLFFQLCSSPCHCWSFSLTSLCFVWFCSVILVYSLTSVCFAPFAWFGIVVLTVRVPGQIVFTPRLLFYCVLPDLAVSLGPFWWFLWHPIFCLYYVSLFYVILPFVFCLLLFYFILFLVDVLQSGIWRDANSLVDLSLRRLVPNLLYLRLESRAPSTVQKYRSGWLKWRQWTAPKTGVQVIPAKPLHVALFISELTVISVSNNTGISSIESVLYGIK